MFFETVELRRYALQPGKRDTLIEREFLETQEAVGMYPLGHYRDLHDPDAFVWFRGFPEMKTRAASLEAFYRNSNAWLTHRDAANATIIDSDNVLLLKPARQNSGFNLRGLERPLAGTRGPSFVGVAIDALGDVETTLAAFERTKLPTLRTMAELVAYFVTDTRQNEFPALPVREDAHAFVVVATCVDASAMHAFASAFSSESCEVLRLEPAARSLFR